MALAIDQIQGSIAAGEGDQLGASGVPAAQQGPAEAAPRAGHSNPGWGRTTGAWRRRVAQGGYPEVLRGGRTGVGGGLRVSHGGSAEAKALARGCILQFLA